jgi:hypothetical protein
MSDDLSRQIDQLNEDTMDEAFLAYLDGPSPAVGRRQVGWYCESNPGDPDYGKHKHDRRGNGWVSRALAFDRPCDKAVPVYIDDVNA